jgi:BAI1-associated protein 3
MARKGHGKSDPYCKLAVIPSAHVNNLRVDLTDLRKSRQVEELIISHTDVRECTLEPQWNKEFTVQLDNVESASLAVEIWDSEHKISLRKIKGFKGLKNYLKDLKGGNDFLGKTNIPLKDICSGGSSDWYNLFSHRGNPRGRVHLKVAIDIKMKGVPLEVALDYYEKLFEVFCMTRATSTKSASNPDLLGQMPEDSMFAEDWSAELGAIPDQFLSLFASRHGITEMQQAIVKLGSLMKYHLLYRISTNAFQKLYAVVLAQQDQLDLSETGLAQPEVMKVVQKLAACTKSLSQDIHTTIRRHPCEVSLTNQFEVDQFRQQIILLKNLHSITCLVEQREEHINELKDVVTEEIKEACSEWYSQTLRRAMKEATHSNSANPNNRVISFLSTVQTVVVYMGLSRDTLQPIFHQLEINYYESVYMAIESKLADELNSIVAEGPIRDVHSGYILYLGLKEFQAMSIHIEENKHAQLKLPGFHRHFKGMVKSWIDLASQRLKEGIVKAASKLAEETVTELSLFSANARDLIDLVAMICDFWKKLSWPDPLESYEFLMHLVGKLSNGVIIFAEETCAQLVQKDFFGQQPGIFTVTQKLCIALNDIEQVRRGMHELPEFVSLRRLKDELQDKGEALADEVENNTSNILTTMDNKIFAILTTVCTQIIEKMRPDIKRGFKSVSEARKHDDFDSMTTPLMGYLHGNLQELRSNVFHSVFLKFLSGLWPVIVERIEKYTSERHKDNIRSLYFCNLLHVLYEFFHAEGEGLSNEDLETHQYKKLRDILMYRTMATEKLLQCYYQDLVAFQANAPSTRGTIDLHVSYMKEKQVIDLTLIRATGLPPLSIHNSCDCYMKISAVPESFFPNAQRMKSEVYRRNLDPVFEAEFALPAREYTLNNPGAAVLVEVYSYDHLKSHVPIGVVVVACKDIPVLAPSTVPEEEELVVESPKRKTLELPIIVPCQTMALTELQERSDGGEALKRIKRLMQSGKKVPSGSSKTLNGIKSKKLFRLRKS